MQSTRLFAVVALCAGATATSANGATLRKSNHIGLAQRGAQPMAGGKPVGEGAYQDPKVVEAATHSKATKCEDNKHTGIECYESGGDYLDGHRMHPEVKSAAAGFGPPGLMFAFATCVVAYLA